MITLNHLGFWVWSILIAYSTCQQTLIGDYDYPSLSAQVQTTVVHGQKPSPQFTYAFPVGSQVYTATRRLFRPPLTYLFTPNTIKQKPESQAQDDAYRKYLKEEAEEMEKERQQNDITADFNPFDQVESVTLEPDKKIFVRVNIMGKNYGYSS